jgi:tRNA(fMet)-specific endonuclease VapC
VSGRYLLDTSVAVPILNGTLDLAPRRGRDVELFLNAIVVGELCFGAEKSERVEANLDAIARLLAACPTILCGEATGRCYARLRHGLGQRGRPIPENDLWIAATAVEHGLVLATRDEHFTAIEDLVVESW